MPTVRFTLDDAARHALTALRAQVAAVGIPVPDDEPAVTVAAAAAVPQSARDALAAELRLLAIPSVWLATLGTVAGRVRGPVAAYLPGTWLPHCVLATARPAEAFVALHPVPPVRAKVTGVAV